MKISAPGIEAKLLQGWGQVMIVCWKLRLINGRDKGCNWGLNAALKL